MDKLLNLRSLDIHHNIDIGIILHDLEDLYLMRFECTAITIYEVSKEIEQFRFIIALVIFILYIFTDFLDELEDCCLVI